MKTIHFVNVEIPAGPLMFQRKFFFGHETSRDLFIEKAKDKGYSVTGHGIEHLLSVTLALAECKNEAESVG